MDDSTFGAGSQLSDRYVLEELIGSGGMAHVHRARDIRHGRGVAVKILKPELSAAIVTERFMREISVVARLTHPHILPLLDSGEYEDMLYYVMPLVEGGSLSDRLKRERPLPIREAAEIGEVIASALDYAHRHNVVHRDIKPGNILLHDGEAVLSDFGVAAVYDPETGEDRLTVLGTAVGTPIYMSPEQTASEPLDGRSDIFSLGTVLYELLTGQRPFDAPTYQDVMSRIHTLHPIPVQRLRPETPASLSEAIETAIAKDPGARFQRAADLALALEESVTGVVKIGSPTAKQRRWPWVVAGALAVSAAGVLAGGWLSGPPGFEPEERQVTFSGDARAAALAPDGRMVAFLTDGGRALQVQDVDGGGAITVVETSDVILSRPRWSRDGRELFFHGRVNSIWGVYSVRRLGGELQLRARLSPSHLDLLPDNRGFLVGSFTGNLEIRSADGRRQAISLGPDIRWLWNVALSPSGRLIAFLGERGDGSAIIATVRAGRTPRAVLVEGGSELLLSAEGLSGNRLPFPQVLGWAADDRAVLFRRSRARGAELWQIAVNRDNGRPTGDPERVATGLPANAGFDVSPGGLMVYYGGPARTTLRMIDLGAGPTASLEWALLPEGTAHHVNPAFSADGRQAAYRRATGAQAQLFVQPIDGGAARRVVTRGEPRLFSWAFDGTKLAVLQSTQRGIELGVVSLEGGGEDVIEAQPASPTMRPTWSRDGRSILYQSADLSQLVLYDLTTATATTLVQDSVSGTFGGGLFSPNADRVVLRRYDEVEQPGPGRPFF